MDNVPRANEERMNAINYWPTLATMFVYVLSATAHARARPATQPSSPEAWVADVRVLVEELPKRHIDPFKKITRDRFIEEADRLCADTARLTLDQFHVRLLQLVALLGDGHTTLSWGDAQTDFGRLPVSIVRLKDGYFIDGIDPGHAALLGGRIIRAGDLDIGVAAARIATLFPYENDASMYNGVSWWLGVPEALEVLGIVPTRRQVALHVQTRDGKPLTATLAPAPRGKPITFVVLPTQDMLKWPKLTNVRPDFYWFEHVPEHKSVYLRYDRCANDPKKILLLFSKELFEFLDAHESDAQRVIIDLRRNGGGNSLVFAPVIAGLATRERFTRGGNVIVLIGPRTFSSGMMNALQLKQHAGAVLMGRPTGQKPNSFGEVRSFPLPNLGATMNYSTKRFTQIEEDDPPSLMPDVLVEPTADDYFAGRDVALERALEMGRP
jgi:hypothetical protein